MVNKVTLIGNLGDNPEIRNLESGVAVGKFPLATNEGYKDKSGEWQNKTTWHNIVVWRHHAERAEKQLQKGSLVYIEGKIQNRKWQDNDGKDHYITEIVASYFRNLTKREESSGGGFGGAFPTTADMPSSSNTSSQATQTTQTNSGPDIAEDDLPF